MGTERIELDDDAVDGVLCRFAYMLMADPAAALAETRRVLRPGGCLALAVWGAPERRRLDHDHLRPTGRARPRAARRARRAEPVHDGHRGRHAGAARRRGLYLRAQRRRFPVRFTFPDIDEYLSFLTDTGGSAASVLQGLPDGERTTLKTQLAAALAPFAVGGGLELPGVALSAVAR